jgi:hypothetical protein
MLKSSWLLNSRHHLESEIDKAECVDRSAGKEYFDLVGTDQVKARLLLEDHNGYLRYR